MTEREALKLALEGAANYIDALGGDSRKYRQALAEQPAQQEGCQCPACQVLPHASDCAVHNGPAYPKGKCDCGVQQEPVAITITGKLGNIYSFTGDYSLKKGDKVYTTPPQRKPLTDEQIIQIASTPDGSQATTKGYVIPFARAIEAAHGIKE